MAANRSNQADDRLLTRVGPPRGVVGEAGGNRRRPRLEAPHDLVHRGVGVVRVALRQCDHILERLHLQPGNRSTHAGVLLGEGAPTWVADRLARLAGWSRAL